MKLLGTLNYETGEIFCVEEEKYDAQVFLSFLEQVLMHYPTGKIIMILDNSRIHHAKRIQPFLLAHQDRLQFVFLPPYSPQLNLIEGLWKWLKEAVINNVFFSNTSQIKSAVQSFIAYQNTRQQAVIERLCTRL